MAIKIALLIILSKTVQTTQLRLSQVLSNILSELKKLKQK